MPAPRRMPCCSATRCASRWMPRMASRSRSASGSVDLNWSWAAMRPWDGTGRDGAGQRRSPAGPGEAVGGVGGGGGVPASISSMVWTMNMSCRSSMALSIQLLKGAARLAYSKCSSSIVSSCFSVCCGRAGVGGCVSASGETPPSPAAPAAPSPARPVPGRHLESLAPAVGQRAQHVPLVADLLAPGVDAGRVVVIQLAARGRAGREGEGWAKVGGPPRHPWPQGGDKRGPASGSGAHGVR